MPESRSSPSIFVPVTSSPTLLDVINGVRAIGEIGRDAGQGLRRLGRGLNRVNRLEGDMSRLARTVSADAPHGPHHLVEKLQDTLTQSVRHFTPNGLSEDSLVHVAPKNATMRTDHFEPAFD